jgi:hypothetical protein
MQLERQRINEQKTPNRSKLVKNYPKFLNKQYSNLHSKFLFNKAIENNMSSGYSKSGKISTNIDGKLL